MRESVGVREPSPEKHFMQVMELEDTRPEMWAQLGVDYFAYVQSQAVSDVMSELSVPTSERPLMMPPPRILNNFLQHEGSSDVSTTSLGGFRAS